MTDEHLARLQQLQREQSALRNLLATKLTDFSRSQVEELLRMVCEEIEVERGKLKASGHAA
jgi:hypothetical protein